VNRIPKNDASFRSESGRMAMPSHNASGAITKTDSPTSAAAPIRRILAILS